MTSKYEIYGVLKQWHYFRNDFNTPKNLTRKYDMTKANCEVYFDESEFVKLSGSLKLESMEGGTFIVSHTANNPVFYGLRIRDKQTKWDYFYFIEETGRMLANGTEYKLKLNYFATWMEPFLFIDKTKYPNDFFPLENFALKRCHMRNPSTWTYDIQYYVQIFRDKQFTFYSKPLILSKIANSDNNSNVHLELDRRSIMTLPEELGYDNYDICYTPQLLYGENKYIGSQGGNVDTVPTSGFLTYTTYGVDGYKALVDTLTYDLTKRPLKLLAEATSLNYVNIDQSWHGLAASQARSASWVRKEANFFLNQCNTDKWFIINKTGTFKSGNRPINYGVKGENNVWLQNVVVAIPLPDRLNDNWQNDFNIYANLLKALSVGAISGQIVKLGSNKFFNTNSGMEVRGLALLDPDNLKITGSGSSTQKGALFGFVLGGNVPDEFLPAIWNENAKGWQSNPSRELQWWDRVDFKEELELTKAIWPCGFPSTKGEIVYQNSQYLFKLQNVTPFILTNNSIMATDPLILAKFALQEKYRPNIYKIVPNKYEWQDELKMSKNRGLTTFFHYLYTTPFSRINVVRNGVNEMNIDKSIYNNYSYSIINNNLGNNFVKTSTPPFPSNFDKWPESSTFTVFNEFGSDAMTSITNNWKQWQVGQNAAEIETIEARRDRYTNPFGWLASLIASTFAQGESDNFSKKYDTFDIQTASAELPIQKFRANAIDTINSSGRKLPKGNKDWIVDSRIMHLVKKWKTSKSINIVNWLILNGWLSVRKMRSDVWKTIRERPLLNNNPYYKSSNEYYEYALHPEIASFTIRYDTYNLDDGTPPDFYKMPSTLVLDTNFRISSFLLHNEDQFRVAQAINEKEKSWQMIVPVKYKQWIYDNLFTSAVQIKWLTSEYPSESPNFADVTEKMLEESVLLQWTLNCEVDKGTTTLPYEQPQEHQQQTQAQTQAEAEPKADGDVSKSRRRRAPRRSPKTNPER